MRRGCCYSISARAIKWLHDYEDDQTADEINALARSVTSTSGVYFMTASSGLLAPYWDPGVTGLLVGLTSYTMPAHVAHATLEANTFHTHAVIEGMKLDSKSELTHLKVDGGMMNGNLAMEVLMDVGRFEVVQPKMRESTTLRSALLAASAVGLFGWDITWPETLVDINTARSTVFAPRTTAEECGRVHTLCV